MVNDQILFSAIIKPIVTVLSCIVGVTEPQGAATQATLCAGFGVVVKDAFPCMPAILSTGTALYAQSSRQVSHELEWIADSGADRDLGCDRAFAQQRFSKEMVNQNLIGVPPTKFETGNGSYTSDSCVQLTGNHFGEAQFNMMDDCPLVRSMGQIVASGKPFWIPDQLPYFAETVDDVQVAANATRIHVADRIDDFVPVLKEHMNASGPKALAGEVAAASAGDHDSTKEHHAEPQSLESDVGDDVGGDALAHESQTMKHRMCHLPKNPFCEICRRAKMYKSKAARVRYDPLESRGHLKPVTKFGERIASDFVYPSHVMNTLVLSLHFQL